MTRNRWLEGLEPRRLLAARFDLFDLGVLDTPEASAVLDVNDSGNVLGPKVLWRIRDRVERNAFTNADVRVGALAPTGDSVIGTLPGVGGIDRAVRLRHRANSLHIVMDLGTLPAGGNSAANAGSDAGIVGHSDDPTPGHGTHAMWVTERHAPLTQRDLNGYVPAGVDRVLRDAVDINAIGQILVTGFEDGDNTVTRSYLMRPSGTAGHFQLLPEPAGTEGDVRAVALNDVGQAVGTVTGDDGISRAVLWTTRSRGTQAKDLGTLAGGDRARATGINNAGFVVGDSTIASGRSHAFLYDPGVGKLVDLNTLVDAPQFSIRHASAVNNLTYIAGEAVGADGKLHGVLLIPKDPMPALPVGISALQDRVTINGGRGNDRIVVRPDPRWEGKWLISLNDEGRKFTVGSIAALRINGGAGDDRVDVTVPANSSLSVDFFGHTGNDRITIAPGSPVYLIAEGGDGDDRIEGSELSTCFFKGGAGDDTLIGGARRDVLWGGFGSDRIVGGGAPRTGLDADDLRGESGDDTITGGKGADSILGGAGDDVLEGSFGEDRLRGGPGNDTLDGGGSDDTLFGNEGDDLVLGGDGSDFAYGDQGDDTLFGQAGDDTLGGDLGFAGDLAILPTQFPGDDVLDGGRGRDYLLGGRESVTFADDNGTDTMTGGADGDVIDARGDDIATDVTDEDLVPARQTIGAGPLAVQYTATLTITASANEHHVRAALLPLPAGTGRYDGAAVYLDAGGVLRMQDTVDRRFTLGEFFRNWGVPVGGKRFGRFVEAHVKINGLRIGDALDNYVVRNGDVIQVNVEL